MGKTIQVYGFPCSVTAEAVKTYLESLTGQGTVYAIEVRKAKSGGPRAYAIVQFTTNRSAESIISLARQRLWFDLEIGSAYSCNRSLVPIVGPPFGIYLPYEILFKINLLVQNGCLAGLALDSDFYRLVDPSRINKVCIEHALDKLYQIKECCYEPSRWLTEQYQKYLTTRNRPRSPAITLDGSLVYVHRIQVTPCKVYFCGPEVNVLNRVLRHYRDYIDNFLRISFIDEDLDKIHSIAVAPRSSSANEHRRTGLYTRILPTRQNGVVIDGVTAAHIREWMGNFRQIRNVAKYAARLGQSFGSSTETLSVREDEFEVIPDVEVTTGGTEYVFSDGIGKISVEFARRVAHKCGIKGRPPSAFQIRFGGYKGVVAVDPTSTKKLSMRRSMRKYQSDIMKLDVLAWSKYQPCFLNRQLITLFSTLGVHDKVFEKKQREAVDQLNAILTDPLRAQEALELMSPGENTNILKEMLLCGYKPDAEPFLSMMLQTFRASKLLELRTKTRIFVQNGRSMMGCLDETRTLDYGQVFVQFSKAASQQRYFFEGEVVVAKNPCFAPRRCSCFKGGECASFVSYGGLCCIPTERNEDPELIPPQQISPMDYTPEPSIQLDHDVTIEEVQEYFTNYIVNDSLGIIANVHTAFADKEPDKAMSDPCIELAKKFSIAVDFPKTGVPAEIPPHLHVKEYPDFMEKLEKPTYESRNVIGKLFREVRDIAPDTSLIKSFTEEVARRSYDRDMEVDGFEDHIEDAFYYKSNYDYKLGNLMDYYGIRTEAEILSGGVLKMSKSFTEKRCITNWYGTDGDQEGQNKSEKCSKPLISSALA
ncbi:hypothetical protein Patl1_15578 [Pistacia atlantica]|uniref:Uncharacterized protein n=1 Tax=Pistacia atlantica TaxID=434234 RepID=A0ACC1B5Y1_9ROSI|nr:hypothetical protein Patl1_15578 [Pistacia atlantica]